MVDVFTPEKRSAIMAGVKGKGNISTEMRLIRLFKTNGVRGWRRNAKVFGKPDFVFYGLRLVVFVDGCFWHGCRHHGSQPASNRAFWRRKLQRNRERDGAVNRQLRSRGWRVLRVWQHELLRHNQTALINKLKRALAR